MPLDEAFAGAVATLIVGLLGLLQWAISNRARARGRDKELFDWGGAVIDLMAAIETLALEGVAEADAPPEHPTPFKVRAREQMSKASALVDKGPLFFLNVQTAGFDRRQRKRKGPAAAGRERGGAYRGFRVKILDEVIRAYLIAQYLAANGPPQDPVLRNRMRAARRRFVSHLQNEMSRSLKRSSAEKSGEPVPGDLYSWPEP
jgi:hypothetical protein